MTKRAPKISGLRKAKSRRWTMMTAYDALTSSLLAEVGVDLILVGDSVGPVLLGYPSTTYVTMDEMLHHARAVRRGAPGAVVIGDLPLKGVEKGPRQALESAKGFLKAGCDGVKLEWGPRAAETTQRLVRAGIPVMGHAGLTPQTSKSMKVTGRGADEAFEVFQRSLQFERNGAFAVLLECVPGPVAGEITRTLRVPVFGIGAGPECDGQVLVFHDAVGLFTKFKPRFVKRYAHLRETMKRAVRRFTEEVAKRKFPARRNSFSIKPEELELFRRRLGKKRN